MLPPQQQPQPVMQQQAPQTNGAPQGGPVMSAQPQPLIASLYVGDLDPEVTEAVLYDLFNTVGPVASIRVCRDAATKRSLGYAYVNFHDAKDAERVMDTLNYTKVGGGRPCRIMWSHRDPNLRKSGNGNVFVKNLDKKIDNKSLFDTFSLFGNILSCKVACDVDGHSKGYGFVHYETDEAAKEAIAKVNGMLIGEKQVFVGEFLPKDMRPVQEIKNFTNIYIKNFPASWTEESLEAEMKALGSVTSIHFSTDKRARAFAFVNFENVEDAHKAIETYHMRDYRSEEEKALMEGEKRMAELPAGLHPDFLVYCGRAQNKLEREQMLKSKFERKDAPAGVNLYVKNLPDDYDDEKLDELFKEFGEITSAKVMVDGKGRSKGFGFVCYKSSEEASRAVTEMHLKNVKNKPLYVGLAEKKDSRAERLQARFKGGKGIMEKGVAKGMFDGKNGKGMGMGGVMSGMPGMGGGMGVGGKGLPGMGMGMQPQNPGQNPLLMQQSLMQQQMMNPMMRQQMIRQPMMGQQLPMMMPMNKGLPGQQMPPMQKGIMPQMGMQVPMGKGAVGKGPAGKITPEMLANASPQNQKQMLGEKLFPLVHRFTPEHAGKITGMMLEMPNGDILHILENESALRAKVEEALNVLNTSKQ